jgi:TRAP-type C4-dicarboxylate transport system permease small subunit
MRHIYARWMAKLYWICVWIAGLSIVSMTVAIPWGVYTRYVLNSASSWPEPLAILLMVLFTFFGAAACYRANAHIAVALFKDMFRPAGQKLLALLVDLLMVLLALFMVIWGFELVDRTWDQTIAEFPWLSVGVTYLPLPLGSIATILFIVEHLWCGAPADLAEATEPSEEAGAELS